MRLFRVVVAAALAVAVSGVSPLLAESAGRVTGHAVDAAGRPLPNLRVELVKAFRGQPVGVPQQANLTDGQGAWSFSGVAPGDYLVRMVYRDRTAGVPVSVTQASVADGVLIVAPSLPPETLSRNQQGAQADPSWLATGSNVAILASSIVAALAAAMVVTVVREKS